jgi:two-component system NtrC family sensor kinase
MDHREFPVLYVDDEPENLRIFELTFRRDFTVLTAQSADEGMRVLNENPVAVVLTDQKMPGMTGVEFLARVRELDPSTVRILVTAYGDVATLSEAINDGRIFRYVAKPWEPDDMRLTVRGAIEMYALDRERDALLKELTLLNQLSRVLHRELDLDRLIAALLNAAHQELLFDGAALLFLDGDGERLRWGGLEPDDDEVAAHLREIEISSQTAPHFLEQIREGEAQTLRVEQLGELEGPIGRWVTEVSADEILVTPLVGKEGVIGALAVDNRRGGRRFGADDRTLLDGLSSQAVIAIENARLVDDLRRSREQVLRADRLGRLGTLAAGLAHEINNPLVSIHTFLSLAPEKRREDDREFWEDYHALACGELERIRGLVATMSRLARGGGERRPPEMVDVGDVAREAVSLMQREAQAAGLRLEIEADPSTPKVLAVREQLHQVLLNLVVNAVHATPEGGEVRVHVGPDPELPARAICIGVEDSGTGIRAEDLERIFDPFFTTKDPDQGTGLGLMITHQIVADHGGSIDVRSEPGHGTHFRVRLPIDGGQGDQKRS